MWATPGKYLRESMLWTLAQQAGDNYAPEYFYRDNATFTNEEPMTRAAVPDEEEKDMAVELALKIQDVMRDTGDDEEDED